MNKMKKSQKGFTLIELIMVIVILGILAATALPKFVDLSDDAYAATAQGFAGALNSANSVNYAGCAAKGFTSTPNVCVTVTKCSELGALVNPAISFVAVLPDPAAAGTVYLVTANDSAVTQGVTATCNAVYGNGKTGGKTFAFSVTGT